MELFGGENAIVGMVVLDLYAVLLAFEFEQFLGLEGLSSIERCLMVSENETGSMVIKDGTTTVFVLGAFFSSSLVSSATDGTLILVNRDELSWRQFVAREDVGFGRNVFVDFGLSGTKFGFGLSTGKTNRSGTVGNGLVACREACLTLVSGAAVEFAGHLVVLVEGLQMFHVEMTKSLMVL
jgi:hypothetical protein